MMHSYRHHSRRLIALISLIAGLFVATIVTAGVGPAMQPERVAPTPSASVSDSPGSFPAGTVDGVAVSPTPVSGAASTADQTSARKTLPLEMTTEVDRSTMKLGDVFQYVLIVRYDPSLIISLPGWGANLGQFEIRDYTSSETTEPDGRKSSRAEYHLAVYDTGEFTIPPVAVVWKTTSESDEQILWSDSVTITVESVAGDDATDVRGLKAQATIPPDYTRLYIVVGSVIAILLLTGVIVYLLIRHSRRGYPQPERPAGPPHEVALAELEALLASTLREEGRIKEFYYELSEIIRRYLGNRFHIYTLERTTEEILEQLQLLYLDVDTLAKISTFLADTDLVKFARYRPTDDECDACITAARQIVVVTKQDVSRIDPSVGGSGTESGQSPQAPDADVGTADGQDVSPLSESQSKTGPDAAEDTTNSTRTRVGEQEESVS